MSSISIRKPEFRLLLGYPDAILTREGAAEPIGHAAPGSDRFGADLRRLASEVMRAGGRLTVVLPASEVWRGRLEPGVRAPRAEWRAARARAAEALGVAAEDLEAVVGRASSGGVPAAAVRRTTLAEVRAFLASVGLKPAAIVGAGHFDGFAAPPRLGTRGAPTLVGRRRAVAGAGGMALAAVTLMVMALRPDAEPGVRTSAPDPAPAVVAQAVPAAEAPAPVLATAAAPAAPTVVATLAIARADPPPRRHEVPLVPKGADSSEPVASVGTRNVPIVFTEARGKPVAELRLAGLTDPDGPLTDVAVPLRRPDPKPAKVSAGDLGPVLDLRPAPRPASEPAPLKAAAPKAAAAAPAGSRPMARPEEPAPVRVASLGDQVTDAVIAAAVLTPLARPETVGAAPAPSVAAPAKPLAAVAPKPEKPAAAVQAAARPAVEKPKVVAPAPKVTTTPKPVPQPVVVSKPAPTVQRVVRVEEKRPAIATRPVAVAAVPARAAKPAPAPVRVASAAPAAPTPEPSVRRQGAAAGFLGFGKRAARNDLALVGIFGGSDGRHALIQMPNGSVRKVSAGDSVQGMQIASIGSDSVRVTDGRRESVLEMPE